MLGLNTGVDAVFIDDPVKLIVAEPVELTPLYGLRSVVDNAKLTRDGDGGVLVVAGYHDRADTGAAAFVDRGLDLRTDRVDHAGQADEAQFML